MSLLLLLAPSAERTVESNDAGYTDAVVGVVTAPDAAVGIITAPTGRY